jgi:hypothetical protein
MAGLLIQAPNYAYPAISVAANVSGIALRRCWLNAAGGSYNGASTCLLLDASSGAIAEECLLSSNPQYYGGSYAVKAPSSCSFAALNSIFRNVGYQNSPYFVHSSNANSNLSLQNCCFLDSNVPLYGSANWSVDHCIFWGTSSWDGGTSGTVLASYNAITSDMTQFPGSNNITITSSPFVNYSSPFGCEDNVHLSQTSGLIDAGDPNAPNDRDGSRRDPGIYGGPLPYVDSGAPDFPFVTNFFVSPNAPQNGVLEIRTTGRVGRGN